MPNPSSARGIVASVGYASGPLFEIDPPAAASYVGSGSPATETRRLRDALTAAAAELAVIVAEAGGEAGAMLEFQLAMVEDDALGAPAFQAVGTGIDADTAWTSALNDEIAGYEASDDAYFRARSADLIDIRDRVRRVLAGVRSSSTPPGAILFGRDMTPSRFLATDWKDGGAIVLREGSAASHVAMLARARGVPMIVGIGALDAVNDDVVLVDAEHGTLTLCPDSDDHHAFLRNESEYRSLVETAHARLAYPSVTADGVPIVLQVNIAEPGDVDRIDIGHCDGVGLMRTEFLYAHGLPDEETQLAAYRKVLEWAGDKPVTIRTVDAGGDKPVPEFTVEESNPFLGLRGIRLCLKRPELFRVQIRALLRAATAGNLKVMLPMVTLAAEYGAARELFEEEARELGAAVPPLGIMVEVPAVAIVPEPFTDVAFVSIGSNDLTQYVMAAARDNSAVSALNDPRHAAVMSLIRGVAAFGKANDIPVSLCGDAGGDPAMIPHLLRAGLRHLSVAPAQLALSKAAISEVHLDG